MSRRHDPNARLGQTIAQRYVLNSIIGEGGAATVYAATDQLSPSKMPTKFNNSPRRTG